MLDHQQLTKHQQMLADFGEFALRSENLDDILMEACRLVGEALETKRAKILEIQQEEQCLLVRAGVGWDPGIVGQLRLSMSERSSETFSIKAGKPVITQDISKEERFHIPEFMKNAGIVALANVPIFLPGGKAYGLLQVDSTEPRDFGSEDAEFLRTYATILGPVIDRLHKIRALEGTEQRFRLIVEAARDYAIFLTDAEDRITDWLPGAEAVFGWTATEIIGQPGSLLFTPEDRTAGKDKEEFETARTRGSAPNRRWHLRKDGARAFIDGNVRALHDESGQLSGFLKIGQDITERRRIEEQLRESEERLRQFGEAASDVLWIRDAETLQWEYLAPAFETIYGLGREAALSGDNMIGWSELIVPEDRERAISSIRRVGEGERLTFEYRIRRPSDGQIRCLRDTDFPIYDAAGRVRRIGGVGQDVTELKKAEAALADSEARLRTLVEGMPQLVWRALDGGQWTWASPQWVERTGLTDEASRGHGWLEAVHPGDREAALMAWDRARADSLFQAEYRIRHAGSGHYHWFQSRSTPAYRDDGSLAEWVGTSTDIDDQVQAREVLAHAGEELERRIAERTAELEQALGTLQREVLEREQAEERLRQSEKLKAIGQLTGGIAHDFNNMLQAITSGLGLVRSRLGQGRSVDAQAYIERAEKAAGRAAALTHRLLAFARQQMLSPESVNLDRVARGMEDMIRRTVGPAVQVELKLADGNWLVLCDHNQMESALLNLCVNARDAMPEGGWLTISTEELVLSAAEVADFEGLQPGRYAAIAVTDTGTGMPPEVVAHVFEPFFTTKPLGEGTGLGLSQIYGFMRQSGGLVQIETAPGKGTTVRLCLPFYELNPQAREHSSLMGKTVLLVEDEHDVRAMVADQLRDFGYRVLEADTGAAALRLLHTGAHVDLLVTDVGLPGGMNGRQLAGMVHERELNLPMIFITGYAGGEVLSGQDVIRKPFETAALARLIEEKLTQTASPLDRLE